MVLWRGRPYGDLAGETALLAEVNRLLELRVEAVDHRVDADLALGGGTGLLPEIEGLVAEHPHRERLRGQLMLALYRAGCQADALRVFDERRRALADELGVDPGPDLADLHERILRHDPDLLARAPPPEADTPAAVLPNPDKGLRTFVEDDRDEQVLCSAGGSAPTATHRRPPWRVVTMVPGRHPVEAGCGRWTSARS